MNTSGEAAGTGGDSTNWGTPEESGRGSANHAKLWDRGAGSVQNHDDSQSLSLSDSKGADSCGRTVERDSYARPRGEGKRAKSLEGNQRGEGCL